MQRLPGLDALRGIAALVVVIGHSLLLPTGAEPGRSWIAVDVFFALSGYVMARTYEARMADNQVRFLKVRLLRLYPLVGLGAVLGYLVSPDTLWLLGLALIWLPQPVPGISAFPLNVPQWSVVIELLANVAHTMIARLGAAALIGIAVICYASVLALSPTWHSGSVTESMPFAVPRALSTYCLGIVAWRVLKDRPVLPFWPIFLLPAVIWLSPPDWSVAPIGIFLVLCGLSEPPAMLAPMLQKLGEWSFPLYAVHWPVLIALMAQRGQPGWLAIIAAVCVAALVDLAFRVVKTVSTKRAGTVIIETAN
ncbi:peptidoglycan/LPS O-acetylase OafA/YrhL [Novosphingobium kunmingense]|uniref:Peptidoglycan/LPS O-acetylase OafA/YrhL n=1 Tax=Novosphingobium kunmingense TaxID=1211806 RepID=A0A2N0HL69_9SPHN|nr:acyltransferase [Novosphingobium kunmingense]PKB19666.1 peptidoglycan/LPS O-acetylase OafA/YrhL [Novosphingobium kunmingense]